MQPEKARVLFVDDDASLLAGLRRILHRFRDQWEMEFCTSGRDALHLLAQNRTHVIVSDIRMPEMDGAELMREVHSQFPEVVRIILSGQAEQEKVLELTEVVHQYFSKPCNPDQLRAAIDSIHSKQQQLSCESLISYLTGMAAIPVLNSKFETLRSELEKPNGSLEKVIEIITSDLGFSMKVLQLTNSHFFGDLKGLGVAAACGKLGLEILKPVLLNSRTFAAPIAEPTTENLKDNLNLLAGLTLTDRIQRFLIEAPATNMTEQTVAEISNKPTMILDYILALWGVHSLPVETVEHSSTGALPQSAQ